MVYPPFNHKAQVADFSQSDLRPPAVVRQIRHLDFPPMLIPSAAVQHAAADNIMAIAKDISLDVDQIADDGFHRKSTAIDLRGYMLNNDTLATIWHCGDSAHRSTLIFIPS
jgi:hypothetical protein